MSNLQKIVVLCVVGGVILVGGFFVFNSYIYNEKQAEEISPEESSSNKSVLEEGTLTREQVENAEYQNPLSEEKIKLVEGLYEKKYPGSASREIVQIYNDKIAFGDVDGDSNMDAAVVLTANAGGSGSFRRLSVVRNQDGEPVEIASKDLGDRVIINTIEIESGKIILNMVVHGPEDGSCCPSVPKTRKFKVIENSLIEVDILEITLDEIEGWQTYRNEEFGFELGYPENWFLELEGTYNGFEIKKSDQEFINISNVPIKAGQELLDVVLANTRIYDISNSPNDWLECGSGGICPPPPPKDKVFTRNFGDNAFYYVFNHLFEGRYGAVYYIENPGNNMAVRFLLRGPTQSKDWTDEDYNVDEEPDHILLKQILSTFRFIEEEQAISVSCESLVNKASNYYEPYKSGSQRTMILGECQQYINQSCTTNQECGSFPCIDGICLVQTCNADSACPGKCGLYATPVPRFCTTIDVK